MSEEALKNMRFVSKKFAILAGLLAVGALSACVRADDMYTGSFKLAHPTEWKGKTLPAGEYEFKLARTQSDVHVLMVHGGKQTLNVLVFAQAECKTCRNGQLTLGVDGDNRMVRSMDLPGYHVDFTADWSKTEQARKSKAPSETVAVRTNSN